ncbi:MAG: 3'-5' exonuclease domain-containing protein 2 [Prevotella sp.]|nr:3'-5' exonuclease domain-containing protein 2 [Prevotella sp.]
MPRLIYNKYDKRMLSALPVETFEGNVVVITNETDARKAVRFLLSCDMLGVDTETRPSFRPGQIYKVSLLQVATRKECFLFRLNKMGITPSVKRLLENVDVPMIGLSWHDDLLSLHRRGEFTAGNFVDLQHLVRNIGIEDLALQKIYANLFHKKINKRQQLSNWDAPELNERQRQYAALDAWACLRIYGELERLERTGDFQLVKVVEPEPQETSKSINR